MFDTNCTAQCKEHLKLVIMYVITLTKKVMKKVSTINWFLLKKTKSISMYVIEVTHYICFTHSISWQVTLCIFRSMSYVWGCWMNANLWSCRRRSYSSTDLRVHAVTWTLFQIIHLREISLFFKANRIILTVNYFLNNLTAIKYIIL